MAAKNLSISEQVEKEIKRLERAAKRKEKEGYDFDLPFRKTKEGKPKTRYTRKDLEKLKKTKPKDLYKYGTKRDDASVSVSGTVIDNCMERSKWRWSDKYYEKFLEVVNKARDTNVNETAQAFQNMINDGTLIGIQKDYKPEDFWVDFVSFTEYFEDIVPESKEELENPETEDDEEDESEIEDNRLNRMTAEEREYAARLFGGKW